MDRFVLCLIYSNNFNNNNKLNNLNSIIAKYKFSRKNKNTKFALLLSYL